jgi:hypothetical protein
MASAVSADSVRRRLKFEYLKVKNEHSSKSLELFSSLLAHFSKPELSIVDLIQEASGLIQKQFRLRWCMIGLKEPDGWYRYIVMTGMREDAWTRQKTKQYKLSDFDLNAQNYKAGEISKLTRIYLEEDNRLGKEDEGVVNRPALLHLSRKSEDDILEADFIDTLIVGPGDELLGWVEYSGTVTGKMPDPMTTRYIEIASQIISAAIQVHRSRVLRA